MGVLAYLHAALLNYGYGTIFQRLIVHGVPPLAEVGGDAKGLTVIVTGPTSGIGWATADELARRGAHVVLACRSSSKGEAMVRQLQQEAAAAGRPRPSLEVSLLDLSSLESVRGFVRRWEEARRPLHALVNNAGMYNMGVGRTETPDGLEVHMHTNHLSHFLLTLGLLPALRRAAAAATGEGACAAFTPRAVHVASAMHHFGGALASDPQMGGGEYSAERAYGNSKLAQVLFSVELARRLEAQAGCGAGGGSPRVASVALHPGNVLTDVVRSLPAAVQRVYRAVLRNILLTPEEGARASVHAATAPAVRSGSYLDCSLRPGSLLPAAADPQLAAWLWKWSAEQVQLPRDWDVPPAP